MVFLQEADSQGFLLATDASIRQSDKGTNLFLDSVKHTLCLRELLVYTSIIAIYIPPGLSLPVARELVHSSPMCLWGVPLPSCPQCGNHNVRARQRDMVGNELLATVKCFGCQNRTWGKGAKRPQGLKTITTYNGKTEEYFWKPLNMVSPWSEHRWRPKRQQK